MHLLICYDSECLAYVLICILCMVREEHFLGAFADFRKAAMSIVLSVCLSVCMELGCHWADFCENVYVGFVEILLRKFKFN
jgi:hypothetical protein